MSRKAAHLLTLPNSLARWGRFPILFPDFFLANPFQVRTAVRPAPSPVSGPHRAKQRYFTAFSTASAIASFSQTAVWRMGIVGSFAI